MSSDINTLFLSLRKKNEDGHKLLYNSIEKSIKENKPIMIGKIGATELQIIYQTILIERNLINDYNPTTKHEAINTGMHPPINDTFKLFAKLYLDELKNINILASWNDNLIQIEAMIWYQVITSNRNPDEIKDIVDLMSLESFYTNPANWWQNLYKNKTILIISPFTDSIFKQLEYPQRNKVWNGKWNNFWDASINFKYIKFPHPFATLSKEEQLKYPANFIEVIEKYKNEINSIGDFDIALIGAGCFSIFLCSYIKNKIGKSVFHLGGGLQMMFGVYGNRWFQNGNPNDFFKEYINEYWIRPSNDEIPIGYKQQENGAYF
jgi:hypothetical protein